MSELNSDRQRDQSDLDAITSSKFQQASNTAEMSDENEDEYEENLENNKQKLDKLKKKPKSSLANRTRNTKSKNSPHVSRHQAYQNEDNNENDEDEEINEEENEEDDEKYPLSPYHQQQQQQQQGYQNQNRSQSSQPKTIQKNTQIGNKGSINNMNQSLQNQMNPRNINQSYSAQPHHYPTPVLKHPNSSNSVMKSHIISSTHHSGYDIKDIKSDKIDIWGHLLIGISYLFLIFSFPFSLCACVKVAQEYERAVIFRLGRILQGGAKGPGIFFVLPCIDTYTKVDLRTVTFDVPPQEILTKDSVTVSVDAVVYFRIFNAVISVINVEDAAKSTKLLAASTLRNILGTKSLHEILSDRESVAILIQNNLDEATGPWGVKVERVEVKDVRLPVQLQRAMATEAEAAREARAKVIAAEGEQKASKALKEAAEVISESPIAIQLRYLQTLTQIASEKNSTIVFPIPLEMLSFLANKTAGIFKLKN